MADISPGQFPTNPSFESVNFRIVTPTIVSETNSGKLRRVGYGHSYYTFDVKYPYLTYNQAGTVNSFVATAQGPLFSFEIVLPEVSYSDAPDAVTANATITTSGNLTYGAKTMTVSNCGANKTVMQPGDYFKFANHSKVYMCTTTVTSNGSGVANVTFSGSLVTNVPSGTRMTITAVPFTVVLAEQTQEYMVSTRGITNLTLSMREVW